MGVSAHEGLGPLFQLGVPPVALYTVAGRPEPRLAVESLDRDLFISSRVDVILMQDNRFHQPGYISLEITMRSVSKFN